MREIKFRIWNKNTKEMICPASPQYFDIDWTTNNWIVPMQYTGLLDRLGKEIYEGDILRVFDNEEPENNNIYVGECTVKYESAMFCTKPEISSKHGDYCISIGELENEDLECEILSNVYENPELIK